MVRLPYQWLHRWKEEVGLLEEEMSSDCTVQLAVVPPLVIVTMEIEGLLTNQIAGTGKKRTSV